MWFGLCCLRCPPCISVVINVVFRVCCVLCVIPRLFPVCVVCAAVVFLCVSRVVGVVGCVLFCVVCCVRFVLCLLRVAMWCFVCLGVGLVSSCPGCVVLSSCVYLWLCKRVLGLGLLWYGLWLLLRCFVVLGLCICVLVPLF